MTGRPPDQRRPLDPAPLHHSGLAGPCRLGHRHEAARLADRGDARVRSTESPRDFLAVATPGAGKTTFALTVAAELLGRRIVDRITVVAPTEHLKVQWAEAAAPRRHPDRPDVLRGQGKTSQDFVGVAVTYAGVAVNPLAHPDPHRAVQDAGHPRRGAPRG